MIFEDRLCMCEIEAEDLDDSNVIAASMVGVPERQTERQIQTPIS